MFMQRDGRGRLLLNPTPVIVLALLFGAVATISWVVLSPKTYSYELVFPVELASSLESAVLVDDLVVPPAAFPDESGTVFFVGDIVTGSVKAEIVCHYLAPASPCYLTMLGKATFSNGTYLISHNDMEKAHLPITVLWFLYKQGPGYFEANVLHVTAIKGVYPIPALLMLWFVLSFFSLFPILFADSIAYRHETDQGHGNLTIQ